MAPLAGAGGADERVRVLYGSQTGTAEEVAWDLAREGRGKGFACCDPVCLDDVDLQGLRSVRHAVFVVSTTGQGDPPGNMRRHWQALLASSLPGGLLKGLSFAVFGLGDSHYREFNFAARKLHARLKQLGAAPFFRLGLGDDQHDFGFEQELDPWVEGMWKALEELCPRALPGDAAGAPECRYEVEVVPVPAALAAASGPAEAPVPGGGGETFEARVVANRSLCSEAHAQAEQDVRSVRLEGPPAARYEAGDVAVVWPRTEPALVRRFVVETLELDLDTSVRVRLSPPRGGAGAGSTGASIFPEAPLALRDIFSSYVDINAVPPRYFFEVLAHYTRDERHSKKLREFAGRSLEAKDELYEYCKRERRSAAEVMWDFWTARPPLGALLSALPPMRPRRYSIASCPRWYDPGATPAAAARFWLGYSRPCALAWRSRLRGEVAAAAIAEAFARRGRQAAGAAGAAGCAFDLCVGVVRYTTKTARECRGLCSGFLQGAQPVSLVRCSLERGSLALPSLSVPLILVCPGTGLSPCRALVQERHLQVFETADAGRGRFAKGLKDLIFLGFRHQDGDFLYGDEWQAFSEWLAVHVAFSRDHEDKKVYVQDLIEEQGKHVCDLLDAGAHIMVCGRSHPMPSQVFDAFVEVLQLHRGLPADAAEARLRELQRSRRYICDTWG